MKKIMFGLSLASVLLLAGCWGNKEDNKQPMTRPEAFVVINVLDPELYKDAHIKGSANVPFDQLDDYLKKTNKDTELVFYCANYMCSASGEAAQQAKAAGFKAFAYEGGMAEWVKLGYPYVGDAKEEYIHAENPKPDHLADYVISAEDLKNKMTAHNIL